MVVKEGNAAQFITVKGAGHGDLCWYQPQVIKKVVDWFVSTLGKAVDNPDQTTKKISNL